MIGLNRRNLMKLGIASAAVPFSALAQDAGSEAGARGKVGGRSESELFLGNNMPGGGQLEIRLTASIYTNDPDQLEVAQRMKPFNLDSWVTEWTRVAEKNERAADQLAAEGRKVTANEYYLKGVHLLSRSLLAPARHRPAHDAQLQKNARDFRQSLEDDARPLRAHSSQLRRHHARRLLPQAQRPRRKTLPHHDRLPRRRHHGRSDDPRRRRVRSPRHGVSSGGFPRPRRSFAPERSAPARPTPNASRRP